MFHPTTAAATKAEVLQSSQAKEGTIRVVLATTALGLGIHIRGLRTVIHLGSRSIEQYLQEMGRAGRDVSASSFVLLWNRLWCKSASQDMKAFLENSSNRCQRYPNIWGSIA